MAHLSETKLINRAIQFQAGYGFNINLKPKSLAKATAFLSHSHKDRHLIAGLIQLWGEKGISVYVDWNDEEMPKATSRITAELIKKKIIEHDWFIIFATNDAIQSRWVSWEIGVADQAIGPSRILMVPIATYEGGEAYGSEYLDLYNRIEINDTIHLLVLSPKGDVVNYSAKTFLESRP